MKLPLSDNRLKAVTLPGHLELLRHIAPPQAIIHIGAGSGNGDMHLWRQWHVPHALMIDADGARLDWAGKVIAENGGWQTRVAVLGAGESEAVFYNASNPAEDGLISPEKLVPFWPNLHATHQASCQIQRLDNVLGDASLIALNQSSSIWVMVDCLSCLPILQGAGDNLKRWSVLCLRVLLKPVADESIATLDVIESFLKSCGYRCIHVAEGNHPAIGEALFVRDWHAELVRLLGSGEQSKPQLQDEGATPLLLEVEQANQLLQKQLHQAQKELEQFFLQYQEEQNRLYTADSQVLSEQSAELALLQSIRDEQAGHLAAQQAQCHALASEKAALEQLMAGKDEHCHALQQEVIMLAQARDEQVSLLRESLSRIDVLLAERENQNLREFDWQAQIDALKQANAALLEEKSAFLVRQDVLSGELTTLRQVHDEQVMLAFERQLCVEMLKQEKSALVLHQNALAEEVASLSQARDEQARLVVESQSRIEALSRARESQAKHQQAQIDALNRAHTALGEEKSTLVLQIDDLQHQLTQITQARDEQARLVAELQLRIEALSRERDAQAGLATDRQAQIDALNQAQAMLTQEKSALTVKCAELAGNLATLNQVRDEQNRLAGELRAHIEALTTERDAQASLAADRQTQIDTLNQAHATLLQEKAVVVAQHDALGIELTTVKQDCDEQTKLAGERLARIETLTQEKSALTVKCDGLADSLATTNQLRDEQIKLASELQVRIDLLSKERDEQAALAANRQVQIDALNQAQATLAQEKLALVAEHETLVDQLATATQVRDEQTKIAAERQSRIDALMQERDKREAEWKTQTDVLISGRVTLVEEKTALLAQHDAIANELAATKKARDEQNGLAARYKNEIDQLQSLLQEKEDRIVRMGSQLEDNEARQRMFNEEMIKAEAQINLIKDVLLREQGL